jgi:DNA-binding LytR/AlgR family response regulator
MIVDDSPQTVETISSFISQNSIFQLQFATTEPLKALEFLQTKRVDCIFLDIEMPDLNGLEFIDTLKERLGKETPKIILITGNDISSSASYSYGVYDFLLKPVGLRRFCICADRLIADFKKNGNSHNDEFIFVDLNGKKIKLDFKEITFIEACGNYLDIFLGAKKITCYMSLNMIASLLPSERFPRVQKSYIISLDKIESIGKEEIQLKSHAKPIKIGVKYKEDLFKLLKLDKR